MYLKLMKFALGASVLTIVHSKLMPKPKVLIKILIRIFRNVVGL